MDAETLRAIQAPLKQRYRDDPASALIPAHAQAVLDMTDIACAVRTGPGARTDEVVAGLHPAGGGSGELACSADLLLQALVACAGVTVRAVALAMGLPLRGGKVIADGIWDARGTLGVDKAAPVGLTEITLRFDLECDAEPAKLDRLVATAERYCVIFQTLRTPPRLSVTRVAAG